MLGLAGAAERGQAASDLEKLRKSIETLASASPHRSRATDLLRIDAALQDLRRRDRQSQAMRVGNPLSAIVELKAALPDVTRALVGCRCQFLVVGSVAVSLRGRIKSTSAIDIWIGASFESAASLRRAQEASGETPDERITRHLALPDRCATVRVAGRELRVYTGQGVPIDDRAAPNSPRTQGLSFDRAWLRRESIDVSGAGVPVIGASDHLECMGRLNRPRDHADILWLDALVSSSAASGE